MPYIATIENEYILHMLANANADQIEINLERLCLYLRKGYFPSREAPYQRILKGLLFNSSSRVRRWTLNAIALLGKNRPNDYAECVQQAVLSNLDDPHLLSAAIAAFFAVSTDDTAVINFLSKHSIPIEGALLVSASQYSLTMQKELLKRKVNIDNAEPLELQNAAILVGLKKANGIFHPRLPDKMIIGRLNVHPDELVSQYSIWAIAENDNFSVNDLEIDLRDIESKKIKQRKWMFLTVVKDEVSAKKYHDILSIGANDPCPEVRESLASGLKNIFYAGIEDMALRWLSTEEKAETVQGLLVHMCANAEASPLYKGTVLERYRSYRPSSEERLRMKAACEKTPLYKELKKIDFEEEEFSLFGEKGRNIVTNNQTFNFNGGTASVVGVTNTGNITDSTIKNLQNVTNPELKNILEEVLKASQTASISEQDKRTIMQEINKVAAKPEPNKIKSLIEILKGISTIGQFSLLIAKLAGFL